MSRSAQAPARQGGDQPPGEALSCRALGGAAPPKGRFAHQAEVHGDTPGGETRALFPHGAQPWPIAPRCHLEPHAARAASVLRDFLEHIGRERARALERATRFRRFKAADVRAILLAGSGVPTPVRAGQQLKLELPEVPVRSLSDYAVAGLR